MFTVDLGIGVDAENTFFYLTMQCCLKKVEKNLQAKKKKAVYWCLFCRSFPHSHTYITATLLEGWKKSIKVRAAKV